MKSFSTSDPFELVNLFQPLPCNPDSERAGVIVDYETYGSTYSAGTGNRNINLYETDEKLAIELEAPGFAAENFKIRFKKNQLIIEGETSAEKEEKGREYHKKTISKESFKRVVALPKDVEIDKESIEAGYERGILFIDLPKTDIEKDDDLEIEVK